MKRPLSPEDMSVAVAYVDGKLEEEERLRFELRLAGEPGLASAVEALLETDELLRRMTVHEAEKLREIKRLRPWIRTGSLAAAAIALVGLGLHLLQSRAPRGFSVALAPSWESLAEFSDRHAELRGLRPPGSDVLRGESAEPNVGAREFAEKARAVEAERAPPPPSEPLEAEFFVVPLATRAPCSVVLLALPASGPARRLVPDRSDPRPATEQARFETGEHTLPSERIELVETPGEPERVRYHRGFVVPPGAGELRLLCAVRQAPLELDVLAAIDSALLAPRSEDFDAETRRLREILEAAAFEVTELRVREPAQ